MKWESDIPLYDFRCETCGQDHEGLQHSTTPNPPCICCGQRTRKLISLPQLVTDTRFMTDAGTLASQFSGDDEGLRNVTQTAISHGYTPSTYDQYVPALARFAGDPEAFISEHNGGRGRIKELCTERGWTCHGSVNVAGRRDAQPDVPIAESLVTKYTNEAIAADPSLLEKPLAEVRADVAAKKTFHNKMPD